MFRTKKDRHVVELAIGFNLSAISRWLDIGNFEFKDIEKIDKTWDKDAIIQSYFIDVLPNGIASDMYLHRKKGIISSNVGGIDYLENVDDNLKQYLEYPDGAKIERLGWNYWRSSISLTANAKPILLAPLAEFGQLQIAGKFEEGGYFEEEKLIKVPISYTSNQPKEFVQVWRSSNSTRSVGYKNALAQVSASTLNFEVEY